MLKKLKKIPGVGIISHVHGAEDMILLTYKYDPKQSTD